MECSQKAKQFVKIYVSRKGSNKNPLKFNTVKIVGYFYKLCVSMLDEVLASCFLKLCALVSDFTQLC